MKILKIQFKNINNLKGKNEISFETDPLNSAGIFAITGPTGSGKSTLLDVITLALFNKIPRFKGSITKSSIENLGSVITHHTSEAMASITYSINEVTYTSTWSVEALTKGKNKGKPGEYTMFIYDSNGIPITQNRSEVPAKNEEIIGLKYDQFVKSIILSQGQFAKFLKADRHERGQLLENITGTSIYRKISMAAFEKYKAVRNEVDLEKDRLENIQVLDDEQRTQISEQIESNEKEKGTLDVALEKLNKTKNTKTEIEKLSTTLRQKQQESENLRIEVEQSKAQMDLLDTYEKLGPILGTLTQYKDAIANRAKTLSELKKNQVLLEEKEKLRTEALKEMEALTKSTITVDSFKEVMSAFENEVNALNQEIGFIGKSGREVRDKINSKIQKVDIEVSSKASPQDALSRLNDTIKKIDVFLDSVDIGKDTPIEEVEKKHSELSLRLSQLKELHQLVQENSTLQLRKEKTQKDHAQFITDEAKFEPLLKTTKALFEQSKQTVELLMKQRQDALLIAKLSDHRQQLKDGEPCPLCGAVHHPYADHLPEKEDSIDQKISEARKNQSTYEQEYLESEKKLTESRTGKQLLEVQLESLETELKTSREKIDEKKSKLKERDVIPNDQLEEKIKGLEEEARQMSQARISLQNRYVVKDVLTDYQELNSILENYQTLDAKKKKLYSGTDVSADCNRLQDQFVRYSTQMSSIQAVLKNVEANLKQIEDFITKTEARLNPEIKKYGFESIEEASAFVISEEDFNELRRQKEALAKRQTGLETEVNTIELQLNEHLEADQMKDVSLQDVNQQLSEASKNKEALIKSIGEYVATLQKDDAERERMRKKAKALKQQQEHLDKWSLLAKLIGDSSGNKFANFAQGLTLQNLLVYANRRLTKLSDRYLLDKPLKDGPLTVVDQYQGNIQRSVSTLSGGESFLISLALALSLSDMASKNVTLESLFIDEGFGTLDQESLDIAMNTLEKLQSESQKMVGVISHVEALKERILVQIKLSKNAQGYGTIKVEG